jgi:fucose permease
MLLLVAFLAFVSLGLPDGVLGVAWPSVRRSFDLPLSGLGVLLLAGMMGYLASSFSSGVVVARLGVGRVLLASSALTTVASLTYAAAPVWPVMVAGGALSGLGAGGIDAAINAYAADRFPARTISWLHASYGVGAMAGPLIMTAAIMASPGWRGGYAVIAACLATMTACFAATLSLWALPLDRGARRAPAPVTPGPLATLRRSTAWTNMALFFLYTGMEVSAGQWSYSLLTEARGLTAAMAGTWVSLYWASLAVGRVLVGILATRMSALTLLRLGMLGSLVGALLLGAAAGPAMSLVALATLGLSLAGIFPLMIAETPARVGADTTTHAVGFQVAAAYLGTAVVPGVAGVLAARWGLETIAPYLASCAALLLILHEHALPASSSGRG